MVSEMGPGHRAGGADLASWVDTAGTVAIDQREAHHVFDIPTAKRQRAQVIDGEHVGALARSTHTFGAERVARGGN